jgi:uncharacterized protein
MEDRVFPTPPITPDSEPFYTAAREGRFLIRRCMACGKAHWYPRPLCPFCFGGTAWEPASGRGAIYSFSTLIRASPSYTIAYVRLDEGPTMLTNIVECDPAAIRIGQLVELVFKRSEGDVAIPCFRPAGSNASLT